MAGCSGPLMADRCRLLDQLRSDPPQHLQSARFGHFRWHDAHGAAAADRPHDLGDLSLLVGAAAVAERAFLDARGAREHAIDDHLGDGDA